MHNTLKAGFAALVMAFTLLVTSGGVGFHFHDHELEASHNKAPNGLEFGQYPASPIVESIPILLLEETSPKQIFVRQENGLLRLLLHPLPLFLGLFRNDRQELCFRYL